MTGALPARMTRKIVIDASGCWLWQGARLPKGYGRVHHEGAVRLAHRVTYAILVGPVPDGLELDHLCETPACVNPAHLEPVTTAENHRRRRTYGGPDAPSMDDLRAGIERLPVLGGAA